MWAKKEKQLLLPFEEVRKKHRSVVVVSVILLISIMVYLYI